MPRLSRGHSFQSMQTVQERKISPKRKFLGRISCGHPGVIRADIPAQNFSQGTQHPGKLSIWAWISRTRRRGRPRPSGIPKNFGQKNFGLNFCSLTVGGTLPRHTDHQFLYVFFVYRFFFSQGMQGTLSQSKCEHELDLHVSSEARQASTDIYVIVMELPSHVATVPVPTQPRSQTPS